MTGYADFGYYRDVYMGSCVGEEEFAGLSARASRYVSGICFGDIEAESESVKLAVCAVCDVMYEKDRLGAIKSESNDGYSISYSSDENAMAKRMYEAARVYLSDDVLYRGIV